MDPETPSGLPAGSTRPPERILVRGLNWLGDSIMTTPALLRLRERFPEAHIALVTPGKLADLWRDHPAINRILTFAPGSSPFRVGRLLRQDRYDLALVLPNSPRAALEVWIARIPRRVGRSAPWRNWLLTQVIPPRPGHVPMRKRPVREIRRLTKLETRNVKIGSWAGHQLFDHLQLLNEAVGVNPEPVAPRLVVAPAEVQKAVAKFKLADLGQPVFGMNPGAEYGPAKRWPAEKFIAAGREIHARTRCSWLIFGVSREAVIGDRIGRALSNLAVPVRNLVGQTSLLELCALLKQCRVLLSNDSGAMHVAAALDCPVIVPFGSTSPELTGPGLPGSARHHLLTSTVPCSPCFLRRCPIDFRCMNAGIEAGAVIEAVLAANEGNERPGTRHL